MKQITFYKNKAGTDVANWVGKSIVTPEGPRKEKQIYLGRVVNREQLIFWNRKQGYYQFNPEDQTMKTVDPKSIPTSSYEPDGSRKKPPIVVDFGDSYFLDRFLRDTGYDKVIDVLDYKNRDTLYAMIHFYILEDAANCHADIWYRHNYASYLYPQANIYSQLISDMLAALGDPEQKRRFLLAHIEYVLSSTDTDVSVLIDSTGLPNKCSLPITRTSVHEGEVNIEFRMIALVQKSTGLPLFYEIVSGNIVDISTIEHIIRLAKQYHCEVQYAIGDAGYCCPATMEKLILSGIDFMTRLNPTYDRFTKVLEGHLSELDDPGNTVRYKGRLIRIVKIETEIAIDQETGEVKSGYIYLCKDMQSSASKQDHLMTSKAAKKMTTEELNGQCCRLGIFAIVSTRELATEEVLPEYYVRQNIEQYFDFGKNYARFLPVRQQNMETLAGHMLLAFIATFVIILIKNRLNIVDTHYTQLPMKLCDESDADCFAVIDENGSTLFFQQQDPVEAVLRQSPSTLFYELRGQKAEIFDNEILPTVPVKQAKDFYGAFRLFSPVAVLRKDTGLEYEYREGEATKLTKRIVFAKKSTVSDEKIEKKRKNAAAKKATAAATEAGLKITIPEEPRKGPGRPKGSKNKATLMKEAQEAATKQEKSKKPIGRPKGSKDKKPRKKRTSQ